MTDSELPDTVADTREEDRQARLERVKFWAAFIEENPPEVWGPQQNALVDSQLRSARESGLDAAHYRRVDRAGRDR